MRYEIVRIINGCKVWIENSVTRRTTSHHEDRRVMPNGYIEWRNFHFGPKSDHGFFILYTFSSTKVSMFNYALFYKFYAKLSTFPVKKCSFRNLRTTLSSKHLEEKSSWRHARESSYSPWCKTIFPCTGQSRGNSCRVFQKKFLGQQCL